MSAIYTTCHQTGRVKIMIRAIDHDFVINSCDIENAIIDISTEWRSPCILSVRFTGCTIVAPSLSAFDSCYFDDDCEFFVENMPLASRSATIREGINGNRVNIKEATR